MSDDTTTSNASHAPAPAPISAPAGGASAADASAAQAAGTRPTSSITEDMVKASLRRVKDPELNLNIVDLGLVYAVAVDGDRVSVDMSLTSPGCPSGPEIMTSAEQQLRTLPGVGDVVVNLVWTPLWSPDRIEPRIRAYLGF